MIVDLNKCINALFIKGLFSSFKYRMPFNFIRERLRIYTFNFNSFEGRCYNLCEKLDTQCANLN